MIYDELLKNLSSDTLLLTPNRRLAEYLVQATVHLDQAVQHHPKIYTASQWFATLWQSVTFNSSQSRQYLMTEQQSATLWRQSCKQNASISELSYEAWKLTCSWCLDEDTSELFLSEEQLAFPAWLTQYQTNCLEHGVIDPIELPSVLCELLPSLAHAPLPQRIVWVGFTELSPIFRKLITVLTEKNCHSHFFKSPQPQGTSAQVCFDSEDEELAYQLAWAKKQIESPLEGNIGLVIPNLHSMRDKVLSEFRSLPFNISVANSLATYPLIRTALTLLSLHEENQTQQYWLTLLQNPYCLFDTGNREHLKLSETLKKLPHAYYTFEQIQELASRDAPKLADFLSQLASKQRDTPNKQSLGGWASHFSVILALAAFPGPRPLVSEEYQCFQRLLTLFDEYAALDINQRQLTQSQALESFVHLCNNTLFQAKTQAQPIQILGVLEAIGLPFEALWLGGLDHQNWPQRATPNPFIPIAIARMANIPHANEAREMHYCKSLQAHLLAQTKSTLISYSSQSQDTENLPSPLLRDIALSSKEQLGVNLLPNSLEAQWQAQAIESINDEQAPALLPHEKIRGGSKILKLQGACPFRAFAEIRLKTTRPESAHIGLSSAERGILLHAAFEAIGAYLPKPLTSKQVEQALNFAITEITKVHGRPLGQELVALEKRRLSQLITRWYTLELERNDFTVVAQEEWQTANLAGLEFHMRLDRLDQLTRGQYLVIDYKTGRSAISAWFGDRMDDPQLPLYAICSNRPISGILYAQVRADEMKYKGITAESGLVPHIPSIQSIRDKSLRKSWPEQIDSWKTLLTQLSLDFQQGNAAVNPKSPNITCSQCDLSTLCREFEHD